MKKLLLALVLSFAVITTFAQPVLTAANTTPKPGDAYITQNAATAGIGIFAGGANQTWNYGNLVDSNGLIAIQAVLPSSTPFADSFPGSNLTIKTAGDSVYVYFNSTTAALLENGVATSDSNILRYDPARTYLPYPFTYGNNFTDSITEKVPGYNFMFAGTDSILGDGYGTLVLPGKTYNNVLRIRYIENVSYSVDTFFFTNTANIRIVSYLYYTPDTHAPLLADVTSTARISSFFFGAPVFDSSSSSRNISYLRTFVLPLSFQSFKASLQSGNIGLQWTTAQEINTDHFTVQRSLTGRNFQDIASLKATGSSSGSVYNYADKAFVTGNMPAVVYYRIQETDKDGRQILSTIAAVRGNGLTLNLYPNPAAACIRLASKDATIADVIALYDAKGNLLRQWNHYSLGQLLDIAGLSRGTYFVKVTIQGKMTTTKFVKE